MSPNEPPPHAPPRAGGGQGQIPEPDTWWLSESPGRPRWRSRPLKLDSARLRPWTTLRWPTSRQAGLTSGALVVAGGIAALALVAFDSPDKSSPPVVTANTQAVAPVAPAQTAHTASPAPTAQPLAVPPPAAGPTAGSVLTPVTQSDNDTATRQAETAAEVPRPLVVRHQASPPVRHQPSRPRPAAPAPDAAPARDVAPASPPPAAAPEQQSQSKWRWKKTTTCDETGRCTHHYNREPNTANGQPAPPQDQPQRRSTHWDPKN
jgi:hypothetical protein